MASLLELQPFKLKLGACRIGMVSHGPHPTSRLPAFAPNMAVSGRNQGILFARRNRQIEIEGLGPLHESAQART